MKLLFHKITHWEYWPFQIVYIPISLLWIYFAIRARTIFFFNAANPTIRNGGFLMDSKKEIYDLIPQQYYPKTALVSAGTSPETVLKTLEDCGIRFPFIAKPDLGLRGSAVKKINNEKDLETYAAKADFDYLVQDLIPFPNEIGVFYVRYPNQEKGKITGIVAKEFLIVTGDGKSTTEQLICKDPRYELQLETLKKEYGAQLETVLESGQNLNLVPYGNHARGAKFIDGSHWITPKLTEMLNEICLQVPGFYFGRLDIMYNSIEEFENGKNFSIVELNGAGSEPTHIYDPKHSLFFAWKELARHIIYMYEISVMNHKNGVAYLNHREGMKQFRLHKKMNKKIVNF